MKSYSENAQKVKEKNNSERILKSLNFYKNIAQTLAPRFEGMRVSYGKAHSAKFAITLSDNSLNFKYIIQIKEGEVAEGIHEINLKNDGVITCKNPVKIFFPLLKSNALLSPFSYSEALFLMGHEMAHFIHAHSAQIAAFSYYRINSNVIYDYRWYLSTFLGLSSSSIWKTLYDKNELEADTTSVEVGGLESLKGGITLTMREVIKANRSSYFTKFLYGISECTPEHEDRLINLLRMLMQSTDEYALEYKKLIESMAEWKDSPRANDSFIKKQLFNLLKKAKNKNIQVPRETYPLVTLMKHTIFAVGLAGTAVLLAHTSEKILKK